MTDDDLERALLALPLEPAPAGLHERILAATVYRVPVTPAFRAWELWMLGLAVAVVAVLTFLMLAAVPDLGDRSHIALMHGLHALGLFSFRTYLWFAVGVSTVWAISSLNLMSPVRQPVYNR
jgi:hypothetical protein